jgi:hypothetical protein
MKRNYLQKAGIPFVCVGILFSLQSFLFEFIAGKMLLTTTSAYLVLSFFVLLVVLFLSIVVLLVLKQFLAASSIVASFVIWPIALGFFPTPAPHLSGLKAGISQKVNMDRLKAWVFAQELPGANGVANNPLHSHSYKFGEIPTDVTQGFAGDNDVPVFVSEVPGGGREIRIGEIGLVFAPHPPSGYSSMEIKNDVFVYEYVRS